MRLLISRASRRRLNLGGEWSPSSGEIELASFRQARALARAMEEAARRAGSSARPVAAGDLNALALIQRALGILLEVYVHRRNRGLLQELLVALDEELGPGGLDEILGIFAHEFLGRPEAESQGWTALLAEAPGREAALRSLIVFWLLGGNPAARHLTARLHESRLPGLAGWPTLESVLNRVLAQQPGLEPGREESLLDTLRAPMRASPDSLEGQLRYLLERWSDLLGELREALHRGLGLIREEQAPRFPPGPGPSYAPSFGGGSEEEPERYSPDQGWMPRLVLIAKNAFVWLDQLSRMHGRRVTRLDEIPDQALDELVDRGFSGLWLIGVWQRSRASERIKKMCGNPEAAASAYSLMGYRIAEELGGEEALDRLRDRAWARGLRLAADMVPNHMGLDSDWLLAHPERFLGLDECPYPAYTFNGPDLSPHPEVGIYLEDHYFDRSDASVVFRRTDRATGRDRFIYHGNDGTSMPWNDTAQLDYLNPETREAVIATILEVAGHFPIIRFDAAMTLARKHFQRLWFPAPGDEGAIPSRAERGMSRERFEQLMPQEFWREVVDRVAAERPDTLLLAEAFWLMEGYFVRTLGMHRVYNSAFMNMLRDQENSKYRRLIKETLAFDPEILKRYVNFMSNPDERTAADQFGGGDRYFGVCLLMATLPGLPMFGHGQVEGFREKYGMEYRKAYWDEAVDEDLVARHQREIAPLLRRRELFAGVDDFSFFDFRGEDGVVNEDVLAYCNGSGAERVVVLFNNRYAQARGSISESVPARSRAEATGERRLETRTLVQALGLEAAGSWVRFHDPIAGLDYLRSLEELRREGLTFHLEAFKYAVLKDFRAIAEEPDGILSRLAERMQGRGIPSLEEALVRERLEPARNRLRDALDPKRLATLLRLAAGGAAAPIDESLPQELWAAVSRAVEGLTAEPEVVKRVPSVLAAASRRIPALTTLPLLARRLATARAEETREAGRAIAAGLEESPERLATLFCWLTSTAVIDAAQGPVGESPERGAWRLEPLVADRLAAAGVEADAAGRQGACVELSHRFEWGRRPLSAEGCAERLVRDLVDDASARRLLGVNHHDDTDWVVKESLEDLLDWRLLLEMTARSAERKPTAELARGIVEWWQALDRLRRRAERESYRLDRLLD